MRSYSLQQSVRLLLCAVALVWIAQGAANAETTMPKAGIPFSMEFRDADIKDVLRAVGQAANMNLVVSDTVTGQVSMSLKDVEIWDALDSILKTKGLTYVREGRIVRVLAVADVRDEDLETRVFPLSYANGKETLVVVDKIKSEKAKVSMDARSNALVVKDLSLNVDRMERLLKKLDMRAPQVLIEAKIVEVASNYVRELGVQWGGQYTGGSTIVSGGGTGGTSSSSGGSTTTTIPSIGTTSPMFPILGDLGRSGNAYAVNLPAAIGAGAGGALGLTFTRLMGGKLALDLQLSAMQTTGNGRILSNPKVLTMNNKEAKISAGTDIPIKIVSSTAVSGGSTAAVQVISASLGLSATPTITSDNRIVMIVKVEKSEPDFSRQVDGIPTITKRSADAQLIINNGETVVLGGILTRNESESEAAVPFLSKIPILGWLFKKKSKNETQNELMIFITPTIVND